MSAFGVAWALTALIAWGAADFLARGVATRLGGTSSATLVLALSAVLPAFGFLLMVKVGNAEPIEWVSLAWAVPLAASLFAAAYVTYYTGMRRGSVSIVASVASAWLAVSVLITAAAFNEHVTLVQRFPQ